LPFPETSQLAEDVVPSIEGGANSRVAAWRLPETTVADLVNVEISNPGRWSPRAGAESFGGTSLRPGGIALVRAADQTQIFWAAYHNFLFRSVGGGAWVRRASSLSLSVNVLHQFVEGNYQNAGFADNSFRGLYGCECVEQTGATLRTNLFVFRTDDVPNDNGYTQQVSYAPACITYFANRLWKGFDALTGGDGSDLAWSELDDGLTYSPANELSIEPGIGGPITALHPVRAQTPTLVVFKRSAIARLVPRWGSSSALIPGLGDELDTITSSVDLISDGIGCIATRSVATVPGFQAGDVFFLAKDGIRTLARSSDDTLAGVGPRLTENVPGWIERINFSAAHKAVAAVYDNAYHLAVPMDGSSENNYVIRLQLDNSALSLHRWPIMDLQVAQFSNDERLFFQANVGYTEDSTVTGLPESLRYNVYRAYQGQVDPGATYVNYELTTRALFFGNPSALKNLTTLMALASSTPNETHAMRVAINRDFTGWETQASSVIINVSGSVILLGQTPLPWAVPDTKVVQRRQSLLDNEPFTWVQFRFSNAGADFARPTLYFIKAGARVRPEVFDNDR